MWDNLTEQEQIRWVVENDEREVKAVADGVARMQRSMEHADLSKPERMVIVQRYETLAKAIKADQEALLGGMAMRGRPQTWGPAYLTIDAEKLAVITLGVAASSIGIGAAESMKLVNTAARIAEDVKRQHELEEVLRINRERSKDDKGFSRNFAKRLSGDTEKVKKLYKKMNDGSLKWSITERIGLGSRLLKILADCNIGWDITLTRDGKKQVYYIQPNEDLYNEVLRNTDNCLEMANPYFKPMTCPPVPWSHDKDTIIGGYRIIKANGVKYRGNAASHRLDLRSHPMAEALAGINAIQSVEWEIDTDTLSMVKRIFNANNPEWSHLIPVAQTDRPKLDPIEKGASKAEIKIWRQKKEAAMAALKEAASRRLSVAFAVATAESLVGKPVFFVHEFDWRGRIYPVSAGLSPQGTDVEKAMLRYAERFPLGKNGLNRLKIWAAGCAGVDKVSFEDRIKWWDTTWGDSPDPDNDMRWTEYDDPFLFAQAAREIRRAIASGSPATYMSNVSCCVDGSQNGLQHLSAMGRDEIGGEAVNLIDGVVPRDLYAAVGNLVHVAVEGDAQEMLNSGNVTDELGQPLPPLVWSEQLENAKARRKTVKRSVLAYPYGVTKSGMCNGLMEDGFTDGLPGSKHRNAWYLAEKIDLAVRDVVVSAARLMDWFRSVAEALGNRGIPLYWETPVGFPCCMRYAVKYEKRIEVNGFKFSVLEDTDEIHTAAQIRGVVANIVHSFDASHAVRTCLRLVAQNYKSFHFVHDSFGCHAGRVDYLNAALRQEFVRIHSDDLIGWFKAYAESHQVEVAPVPSLGKLDLEQVKTSSFFFA
jgi:DNA-directed RNA polymerase